jgi:CopG family nickel-responsive transcriptional regulator
MSETVRFSVSIESELLQAFDAFVARQGHATRSEAIKRLMRNALSAEEWSSDGRVAGALVLVYDHHRRDLVHKLIEVQHDYGEVVISTQHVHLDHDDCLEVVTLRGAAPKIRRLVAAVKALKGLKHASLVTTTGTAGEAAVTRA